MSLERATYILLIPGIKARNTETIAIDEAKTIKNENSENLLTSIATRRGVLEFIINLGLIIDSVNHVTAKYNKIVTPRAVKIAVGIISFGFFISSPNVASLEYPVKAKNHILADKKILSTETLSKIGILKLIFGVEMIEIV